MRKGIVGLVALAAVTVGGLGLAIVDTTRDPGVAEAGGLLQYDDCDALLDAIRQHASEAVGPHGLDGDGFRTMAGGPEPAMVDMVESTTAAAEDSGDSGDGAATPTTAGGDEVGSTELSTTNVQEEGVDEADVVKTDGERLVTVIDGTLRVLDLTGDQPTEVGHVELSGGSPSGDLSGGGFELFLTGDTALVLGVTYGDVMWPMPVEGGDVATSSIDVSGQGTTTLVEVDLTDETSPQVVARAEVQGAYSSARMVGDVARIVTATYAPDLGFVYPSDGGDAARQVAEQTNRRLVEQSTLDAWLPLASLDGGDPRPVVACDQVGLPEATSGFGTATVVTVDLADGLAIEPDSAASVLGGSEVVYASADNLYVATSRWPDAELLERLERIEGIDGVDSMEELDELGDLDGRPLSEVVQEELLPGTAVHRFALPPDGPATYEASGQVPGRMLSQFSFSEHAGHLRVATTVDDPGGSTSRLTVLAVDDLDEVGAVGDIGPPGEELYAVRMMGDVGYVVTFERTDPLFTLDLSDPGSPRVVGELEIPGYSAYLHPISDELLLGIGQAGTEAGVLTGTQVSLFDVSDPASPQRIQQYEVDAASSEAEYDHRAFLWWGDEDLAVIPLSVYGYGPSAERFEGAVGLRVTAGAIAEVGAITHPDPALGCEPAADGDVRPAEVDPDDGVIDGDDLVEPSEPVDPGDAPDAELPGDPDEPTTSPTVELLPNDGETETTGCEPVPIRRSMVVGDTLLTLSHHLLQQSDLGTLEPRAQVALG